MAAPKPCRPRCAICCVFLYGSYGTLDIALLAARLGRQPVTLLAAALMTAGLLAKTALFPLHLWLPPAHAGAPAAASALLSALVIKGGWFLVVRLWVDVFAGIVSVPAAQFLAQPVQKELAAEQLAAG